MTNDRIRRCYGFGAARLCVSPAFEADAGALTLREDLLELARLRTLLGTLPGLAALVFVALVFGALLRRPVPEETWLELVRVLPEPELPIPEVVPEEPPRLLPLPEPSVPRPLEVTPEPPPTPAAAPIPKAPAVPAAPAMPAAPAPLPEAEPLARVRPEPLAPPRLDVPKLRMDPVAVPEAVPMTARSKAPPVHTPARRPAPPRGLSLPASSTPGSPAPVLATRSAPPAARPSRRAARPAPAIAAARSSTLTASADPIAREPAVRPTRRAEPARTRSRTRTSQAVVPASFAPDAATPSRPRGSVRVALAAAAPARSRRADPEAGVAGVPLASLDACLSDREENQLKLEVLSVLDGRRECSSDAGRYRFVETRNLGTFLMWIERARSREQADRCAELRLALGCLGSASQSGATRP